MLLAAVNLLSLAVCQDYCINPCCDLTGSPSRECNSCTDTTFAGDPRLPSNGTNGWCRPGMPNYLESERHGDMSDTAQCREHHRNINRGGHDPGISMGAVFGHCIIFIFVAVVLVLASRTANDIEYGKLLAVATSIWSTVSALGASLMSFRCTSCYFMLIVSMFVIVPIQCVAWILGITGCWMMAWARNPSCCCGDPTGNLNSSKCLNLTAVGFLALGLPVMVLLRGNYNTAQDGLALFFVLCAAELVRIAMLVACSMCACKLQALPPTATTATPPPPPVVQGRMHLSGTRCKCNRGWWWACRWRRRKREGGVHRVVHE